MGKEDEVYLSTSPEQFLEQGGPDMAGWLVPTTVTAFFQNGGKRVYHVRVVPADAVVAGYDITELINSETPAFAPVPDGLRGKVAVADHSGTPESDFVLTLALAPMVDTLAVTIPVAGAQVVEAAVFEGDSVDLEFNLAPPAATLATNVSVYNDFVTKYNAHCADFGVPPLGVHIAADAVNVIVPSATPDTATFITKINSLRAALFAHGSSNVFHTAQDPTAPPVGGVATYSAAVVLLRKLVTWYEAHRVLVGAGPVHTNADAVNTVSAATILYPYNATGSEKLEPGSVEFEIGAATYYDKGDGTFIVAGDLNAGTVNYATGAVSLTFGVAPAVAATVNFHRVVDRTTATFYITADDEFVDVLVGGSFPAAILNIAGVNEIDRTAKTISFKTASTVIVPDGALQANYTDVTTTGDVDYTKLYWKFECVGRGIYGNDIAAAISGEDTSFVSVLYDRTKGATGDWVDTNGNVVGVNPNLGKYLKYKFTVRQTSEIGGSEFVDKEPFRDLNFSDPDMPSYFPDVINDPLTGSKLLKVVTPYGVGIPEFLDAVKTTENLRTHPGGIAIVGDNATSHYAARLPSAYSGTRGFLEQTLRLTYTDSLGASQIVYDDGTGRLIGNVNAGGANTVDYDTGIIDVTFRTPVGNALSVEAIYYLNPSESEGTFRLTGGSNGSGVISSSVTVNGALDATKRGIYAFKTIEEPLTGPLVPDLAGNAVVDMLIVAFCEARKNFFLPIVGPRGMSAATTRHYRKAVLGVNTSYGAMYAPWIKIVDPILSSVVSFPPLGHIAGIYARVDSERNVGETPAGTEKGKIYGAVGLETIFTKEEVGILNEAGVNCIVDWPQTGRVVWGGRTLSYTSEWKYISARRLFTHVEMSLYLATWWACFENNGANLRLRLFNQVYNFLRGLYNEGYFNANAKSEGEAFYVVCDDSNNPQSVVDAGQVLCDVYIAPSKPAEFVRLRFTQITQGAST
jgi:hypothetical protein